MGVGIPIDVYSNYGKISNDNEWISLDYLKAAKTLTVIADGLNFRKSHSTDSTKLCTKPKGTSTKIFAKNSNGWYLTEFGWCSGNTAYVSVK